MRGARGSWDEESQMTEPQSDLCAMHRGVLLARGREAEA